VDRKVLIAIDDGENSLQIVDAAARIFQPPAEVCLLGVVPVVDLLCDMDPLYLHDVALRAYPDYCRTIEQTKEDRIRKTLEAGRERLIQAGFNPRQVHLKLQRQVDDVAVDIVEAAAAEGCGTIVLGSRRRSKKGRFLMGSVTQKVLHAAGDHAVLVIR